MSHWVRNVLVPDEPKPAMETQLTLEKKINQKLDTLIENTTPAEEPAES